MMVGPFFDIFQKMTYHAGRNYCPVRMNKIFPVVSFYSATNGLPDQKQADGLYMSMCLHANSKSQN